MNSLCLKLWADDKGAVVASELILIVGILVIGLIPGLVALRNAEDASLADIGNELLAIQTDFSFAGFAIKGTPGDGTVIAQVGGFSFSHTNITFFSSTEATDNNQAQPVAVDPAP